MDEFKWWRLDHLRKGRLLWDQSDVGSVFFLSGPGFFFFCVCVCVVRNAKQRHLKTHRPHEFHFFGRLLSVHVRKCDIRFRECETLGPK